MRNQRRLLRVRLEPIVRSLAHFVLDFVEAKTRLGQGRWSRDERLVVGRRSIPAEVPDLQNILCKSSWRVCQRLAGKVQHGNPLRSKTYFESRRSRRQKGRCKR